MFCQMNDAILKTCNKYKPWIRIFNGVPKADINIEKAEIECGTAGGRVCISESFDCKMYIECQAIFNPGCNLC